MKIEFTLYNIGRLNGTHCVPACEKAYKWVLSGRNGSCKTSYVVHGNTNRKTKWPEISGCLKQIVNDG